MPKFKRISKFQPLVMPAVRTKSRKRKDHSFIELKFRRSDFKGTTALFVAAAAVTALNNVFDDCRWNFLCFIRNPIERDGYFMRFWVSIFPAITKSSRLALREGE